MILKNMRLTVVLAAFFAFWANPVVASSILELGSPNEDGSVVSLGEVPEKTTKEMELGGLRFTKGVLPAGRLTLKQRMRKRLRLGRSRNETLSRSNRERLKRVRRGGGEGARDEEVDDIAAYRDRRRNDDDEEDRTDEQDEEDFKDIEDQLVSSEDEETNGGNSGQEDDDDVPVRNDADESDNRPVAEAPEGDVGVRGGVTSAGKSIELKEGARDPNGDIDIGVES
ncbi:MAG: hypothetical protein AAFQ10_03680 [Pseudomonadota bacterium]